MKSILKRKGPLKLTYRQWIILTALCGSSVVLTIVQGTNPWM